jgi:hypothetical protein
MLPRLSAEESMQMANRIAVGMGALAKEDRSRMLSLWERTAHGDARQVAKANPATLRGIGIGVRRKAKR